MSDIPDPWPLRNLVLRTPRLELRPDDDAGLLELVDEAYAGVHPPEEMPFLFAWTDLPRDELGRNVLQFYWRQRAALTPHSWNLNFLVRLDGRVIGNQGVTAKDFGTCREVLTGSWIGLRHHGKGLGTEMRSAVLQFVFDHLGAVQARSEALADNEKSHGVSRKLGYLPDGTNTAVVRGKAVTGVRLLLTRERFQEFRPPWTVVVSGLAPCLPFLGAEHGPVDEIGENLA